ncbi:TIGR00725 family protein [bacterium]|nr:TIGR00725 family protein [bacterium]
MDRKHTIWISVIGGSVAVPKIERVAERVGELLARAGAVVVCGGLGGVMKSVSKGAKENGGTVVGILPGDKRSDANEYVDYAIPTGLGIARNLLVVRSGDAVIAIDGKWGTLSEIALAKSIGKTVIALQSFELDDVISTKTPEEAVELALSAARESLLQNEKTV